MKRLKYNARLLPRWALAASLVGLLGCHTPTELVLSAVKTFDVEIVLPSDGSSAHTTKPDESMPLTVRLRNGVNVETSFQVLLNVPAGVIATFDASGAGEIGQTGFKMCSDWAQCVADNTLYLGSAETGELQVTLVATAAAPAAFTVEVVATGTSDAAGGAPDVIKTYRAEAEVRVLGAPAPVCAGLEPVADTYVRGGSFADTPFGTGSLLLIKGIASLEYARKAYLVFDAKALPSSFTSVTLQLTLRRHTASNPRDASLYGVIDNLDWDPTTLSEGSMTWNNAPRNIRTSGTNFAGQGLTASDSVRLLAKSVLDNTDPAGTTYLFDVTDYVKWTRGSNQTFSNFAPAGDTDGRITLLLAHSSGITGDDGSEFHSREATEACSRPQLIAQ